ncbi:MAG: Flp pilus assembly complex ATPase component TadA [Alphaproteobacteria bacterium]|nr:Flp pilus assembly complex ATPase component TadA [Alphaproteobacteria bacterium]MBV8548094.1 Flp pilus assembly complex ATPase component TadA [Alphaproteobacteria bacterium]
MDTGPEAVNKNKVTQRVDALSVNIGTWPDEPMRFFDEHVDALLLWCVQNKASDTTLQSDRPVYIEVDGTLFPVTRRSLDSADMANILNRLYGTDALAKLAAGYDLDLSYEVRPERNVRHRFRVNITAIMSRGRDSVQITMRTLPALPPTMKDLGIESKIIDNWAPRQGLILVTGPTGSGKTTLLASGCRMLIEREQGCGKMLTYEAPIEYVYDGITGPRSLVAQSEIPRHLPSFAAGVRNALRRKPNIILVGEARDKETVSAAIEAGQTGHLVFSTVHTIGVAATVRRMISVFDPAERTERAFAMMETMRMIVTQALLPKVGGGRIGLREYLVFDEQVREQLLDAPIERWTTETQTLLLRHGQTMEQSATKAFEDGLIDRRSYLLVTKGFSGDDAHARDAEEEDFGTLGNLSLLDNLDSAEDL